MNLRIASSEGYEELISAEVGGRPSTVSVDWPLLRFIRLPAVRVDPFSVVSARWKFKLYARLRPP